MDVWVVGAGITGAVAVHALERTGAEVGWIAARPPGLGGLPYAMVNPVRGKRGVVVARAAEALTEAARLYGAHAELHRGLWRPVPEALRAKWRKNLRGKGVAHVWRETGVELPEAFWLEARPLLRSLAAGRRLRVARVVAWREGELRLASGERLEARRVVWAAGAEGAALSSLDGRFTPGSQLLTVEGFPAARAQGIYAAGHALGGSYLPHETRYRPHVLHHGEAAWILEQARALLGYAPHVWGAWSGVRWRLDGRFVHAREGGWVFGGFGSTAFLLAPLYARELAREVQKT